MPRLSVPAAEVDISAALVRNLLSDQHPDLSHLPLLEVTGGWDNALFRLGDALAVRLPRRAVSAPLIENEHRWLGQLAAHLPLPVPEAQRVGRPGRGYPWSWGVSRWIDGQTASALTPLSDSAAARTLGSFLRALHAPAPHEAPISDVRGIPLAARTPKVQQHVQDLGDMVDGHKILACWDTLMTSRPWPGPRVWVHGDLHPGNVIVANGRVAGVIDFGDLTAGDPATDLAAAWMLFSPDVRATFREAAAGIERPISDDTWNRARGWALTLNLAWLTMSVDDEETTKQSLATIDAVLAEI